jgi:hypothetical protein
MPFKTSIPSRPTVIVRKKRPTAATGVPSTPAPALQQAKTETVQPPVAQPKAPVRLPPQTQTSPVPAAQPPQSAQPSVASPPVEQPPARDPNQPNRQQRETQLRWELLKVFRERWPQMFPADLRQCKPLAVGIHQEIVTALPDVKPYRIRQTIALFQRGGRGAYWRAVLKGGPRYNLDGTPKGEVTAEEQDKARQDLQAVAAQYKARREGRLQSPSSPGAEGKGVRLSQEVGTSAG